MTNYDKADLKCLEIAYKEIDVDFLAVLLNIFAEHIICMDTKNNKYIDLVKIRQSSTDYEQLIEIAQLIHDEYVWLTVI